MENLAQRWTKEQLKLAFYLYCQIPFGKLHSKNPIIIKMASFLGRTSNALAMKLVNFASLDPSIKSTGRKGLGNASRSDREIWDLFHNNWTKLAEECESLMQGNINIFSLEENHENNFFGETHDTIVKARIGQNFFRKSVLASYENICCMSGVSIPELLIASHIIPWAKAKDNRLNPSNGLCLSAIHDRAFDKGFLTVLPDYSIKVSNKLSAYNCNSKQTKLLIQLNGKSIKLPGKFLPEKKFLVWHNNNIFIH
jgi:predicted restriction endonuclease